MCDVTASGADVFSERKRHLVWGLSTAAWFLYLWVVRRHFLAIHHEDEISVHSWGGEEHHHELLPHTAQPVCLCGALQCKQNVLLLSISTDSDLSKSFGNHTTETPFYLINMMIMLQVNAFPITVMFGMCSIFLFMAAILQRRLMVVADLHKLSTSNLSFL